MQGASFDDDSSSPKRVWKGRGGNNTPGEGSEPSAAPRHQGREHGWKRKGATHEQPGGGRGAGRGGGRGGGRNSGGRFGGRGGGAMAGRGRGRGRGAAGRGRGRGRGRSDRPPRFKRFTATAEEQLKAQRARAAERRAARREAGGTKAELLEVPAAGMSPADLAQELALSDAEVVKALFMKGIMCTVNQVLDADTIKMVCDQFEVEYLDADSAGVSDAAKKTSEFVGEEDLDSLAPRPPIVTIMGHVDHGKTSLLDYIRQEKVADGEAGGITQGIGAYRAEVTMGESDQPQPVVFLDTPGHEAFSAMRARGARVTDIAVIVCAADDGVRPQTEEAVAHAQAAGVPIVVAITKIDKEGADIENAKNGLAAVGLTPEEWGGEVPFIALSSKTGDGVEDLLEALALTSEMAELKANPTALAKGTVVEARLEKSSGATATVVVQNGTLKVGDSLSVGAVSARVRALTDSYGNRLEEASPSMACTVVGLSGVPEAGDIFTVHKTDKEAKAAAKAKEAEAREKRLAAQAGQDRVSLARTIVETEDGSQELQRINVVLKVDSAGVTEAIKTALAELPQDRVLLRFLLAAPGEVSRSDIDLAAASDGLVLTFNAGVPPAVEKAAEEARVEVRQYQVIYDMVDDLRTTMEGRMGTVKEEEAIGKFTVKAVFGGRDGKVAGGIVTEGRVEVGCRLRGRRGKKVLCEEGELKQLRRFQDNVTLVEEGTECGLFTPAFENWEGDEIEAFVYKPNDPIGGLIYTSR